MFWIPTNVFELVLTSEGELAGLPLTAIASARESAQRKGLEGWRFTLQAPDYFAVMTYLDKSDIRRKVYEAFAVRATSGELRQPADHCAHHRAAPRGRPRCWASAISPTWCWKTAWRIPASARCGFLEDLKSKTERRFHEEIPGAAGIPPFAGRPDAPELAPWDVAYYAEKQRHGALRFRRGRAAPLLPDGKRGRGFTGFQKLVHRLYGMTGDGANRACLQMPQSIELQCPRRGFQRRLSGRLLRRLVSSRERAAARGWMRSDYRRPRHRRLPPGRTWD